MSSSNSSPRTTSTVTLAQNKSQRSPLKDHNVLSKRTKRSRYYQLDALAAAAVEVEANSAISNSPSDSTTVAQAIGARVTLSVRTGVHAASAVARAIGNSMSPQRPVRRSKRHQPK